MERPRQAVILAGGRGTRLGLLTADRPKPMVEVAGRPFLWHQIELLRDQGFTKILLLLGYLPHTITEYFGDGSSLGVDISYSITDVDDLTAKRLALAADLLDEHFLLAYCDNYLPMNFTVMWEQYKSAGLPVQVTGYLNRDGYSKSGMRVADAKVEAFDRTRSAPGLNAVEISYAIMNRDVVLNLLPQEQELLEQAVYPSLVGTAMLGGYLTEHRYYSCGDDKKLAIAERFFARTPTVILDRDGTMNVRPPQAHYITNPAQLEWLPGALEAMTLLGRAGYRILVVSNQAGIGRGAMTTVDLDRVTEKLMREAAEVGGPIERVYHCPHGWNDGCLCRKPLPGMLHDAQRDFDLDLTRTLFIGDDERDGQAAAAAGALFERVDSHQSLLDIVRRLVSADHRSSTHLPATTP